MRVLLLECVQESVGGNLVGRYGAVGVLEQTECGFGMVVSGFVYGAVEQDEVTPVATDVEVFYGDKGYGLGSESVWERGLRHIVLLRVCRIVCVGFQGEFVVVRFRDTGADQPPGCFQVSDEFVCGRQGEDAGSMSERYVGSVVGGLDESGGAWGAVR